MNKIAELNDKFRKNPYNGLGRIMVTHSVSEMGDDFIRKCSIVVREFDNFNVDNDPHHEHDFFKFEVDGEELFFKIDYYDKKCEYGSPDPADPNVTTRIGTIMLVEDY